MELILKELDGLALSRLYERELLSLEELSDQEVAGLLAAADALQLLRKRNYGLKIFESGLGLFLGEPDVDFWGACDLLGLRPFQLDEDCGKEALLRSAALADVIGVGTEKELLPSREAAKEYENGLLDQRPTVLNLELADPLAQLLWLIHELDGVEHLRETVVAFDRGEEIPGTEKEASGIEEEGLGTPEHSEAGRLLERMGAVVCPMDELFPQGKEGPMLHAQIIPTQGTQVMKWRRYRPYVIAAMIFLAKAPQPVKLLRELQRRAKPRRMV